MKRKALFLISTLTLLGSIFHPLYSAQAEILIDGERYYTPAELLEIGREVETIKEAECGKDYDYWCGFNVMQRLISSDRKYMTYDSFQAGNTVLTSINPNAGTAKIIYRDITDIDKMVGTNIGHELSELVIYWLEPEIDTLEKVSVLGGYIEQIWDGTYDSDKIHVLYAGRSDNGDFDWLKLYEESTVPLNTEVGYSNTQSVHFFVKANGKSYGYFSLQNCLTSSSYTEGSECVRVYGENLKAPVVPMAIEQQENQNDDDDSKGTDESEDSDSNDNTEDPDKSDNTDSSENPVIPDDSDDVIDETVKDADENQNDDEKNNSDKNQGGDEEKSTAEDESSDSSELDEEPSDKEPDFGEIESEPIQPGADNGNHAATAEDPEQNDIEKSETGNMAETVGTVVSDPTGDNKSEKTTLSFEILVSDSTNSQIDSIDNDESFTGEVASFIDDEIELPLTSTSKGNNECNNQVIFPWWLLILSIMFFIASIIILFVPVKRQKHQ